MTTPNELKERAEKMASLERANILAKRIVSGDLIGVPSIRKAILSQLQEVERETWEAGGDLLLRRVREYEKSIDRLHDAYDGLRSYIYFPKKMTVAIRELINKQYALSHKEEKRE